MSLSTYLLVYGRHVVRLLRHRAYAPTSNTASHDYDEKKIHGIPLFLYEYGAPPFGLPEPRY